MEKMHRKLTALCVCVPPDCVDAGMRHGSSTRSAPFAVQRVDTASQALEVLRISAFDLVLTCDQSTSLLASDLSPWEFIRAMRARWPRQRWAMLASPRFTAAEEVRARCLGVLAILDRISDLHALHDALRPSIERMAIASATMTPALLAGVAADRANAEDELDLSTRGAGTDWTNVRLDVTESCIG